MSNQVPVIEGILKYIEKTGFSDVRYDLNTRETRELFQINNHIYAVILAFRYGQAKGYRAASAEAKRKLLSTKDLDISVGIV